jgi:hypothetical protein
MKLRNSGGPNKTGDMRLLAAVTAWDIVFGDGRL